MLSARAFAGVAVINDTFYVVGGVILTFGFGTLSPTRVTEQYTPFGYGTIPTTTKTPEPASTPLIPIVVVSVVSVTLVGIAVIIYFQKRKRKASAA
jgi:hypothetical protein